MADGDGNATGNVNGDVAGNSKPDDGATGGSGNSAGTGGVQFFDPGSIAGNIGSGGGGGRRKRGRPAGSGRKPDAGTGSAEKEKAQDNLNDPPPFNTDFASAILISMHGMVASFTQIPEIEITENDAKTIAGATKTLMDLYKVAPSEKTMAWMNFSGAVCSVYGMKFFAYKARRAAEKMDEKKPQQPSMHRPTIVQ